MKKLTLYSFLLLFFATLADGSPRLDRQLQQVIDQARATNDVNALSLSVALPGQEKIQDYVSGNISMDSKTPISAESLFQVGSITKNFTTVLLLRLVDTGKITLDDPIGKYFPQYPKWQAITPRQLLNHTSGIYDYIDEPNWWDNVSAHQEKIFTPEELLKIAYHHPPYFEANHGWHYSNSNYVLAGFLVEKISGETLSKQMRNLFETVGMPRSYYLPINYPVNILSQMVNGYYQKFNNTEINGSWAYGAGALVSTPHQIVTWVNVLFDGKIISHQSVEAMQNVVALSNGQASHDFQTPAYGLGLFRMNTPAGVIWFTPGLTPGYRSLWVHMPCIGISFAYSVSNSLMGKGSVFHTYMMRRIIQTLLADKTVQKSIYNYQHTTTLPSYCHAVPPAERWKFVAI